MEILSKILAPIIWAMEKLLLLFEGITGSMGLSILCVSLTFALLLVPIRKIAERFEARIGARMSAAAEDVAIAKQTLKGEALFDETERIYKRHGYHPIQSIGMGASFFISLPILLGALVLFSTSPLLEGESFLMVQDLSKPDGILGPINLLPILMSAVTIVDARIRFKDDRSARVRFYIIAAVLFALVYTLASGLVLYWTMSNLFALVFALFVSPKTPAEVA